MAKEPSKHKAEIYYNPKNPPDYRCIVDYSKLDTQEVERIHCGINGLSILYDQIGRALEQLATLGIKPDGDLTVYEHTPLTEEAEIRLRNMLTEQDKDVRFDS